MDLRPEHYHRAALERMEQAHVLYHQGASYSLAMYIAGVAVECMLRAFRILKDSTFDERHDLLRLFKASGMLELDLSKLRGKGLSESDTSDYFWELQAAVNEVCLLWSNAYRYVAEERLRKHLKKNVHLRVKVRGDVLKTSAIRILNAAQRFVSRGDRLWVLFVRR